MSYLFQYRISSSPYILSSLKTYINNQNTGIKSSSGTLFTRDLNIFNHILVEATEVTSLATSVRYFQKGGNHFTCYLFCNSLLNQENHNHSRSIDFRMAMTTTVKRENSEYILREIL